MRKLIDGLAIASFVLSLTTVGAIGFGYLTLTNKTNQEKIKNYAIGQVQKLLTDQLSESIPSLPDVTGNVVPTGPSLPKF
jgi:hypothetical protein